MTITEELEREIDAIGWEMPTASPLSVQEAEQRNREEDPDLYAFITEMAELLTDAPTWRRFTVAFHRYNNQHGIGSRGRR